MRTAEGANQWVRRGSHIPQRYDWFPKALGF